MDSEGKPGIVNLLQPLEGKAKNQVNTSADEYLQYFDENDETKTVEKNRKEKGVEMTSHYYDIVTDFYEYGWGESFHFSTLRKGESREHSFAKHEYKLALKLNLNEKDKVLVSILYLVGFTFHKLVPRDPIYKAGCSIKNHFIMS